VAKSEKRTHRDSGTPYTYSEGAIAFPDPLSRPSRTILTGEGGPSPSRFKHVIEMSDGRLRRLTPIAMERLNGFPEDWIAGVTDGRRAFLMGNALVVGIVARISSVLGDEVKTRTASQIPYRVSEPVVATYSV
jgi:DNA (cytosine-5)-methyltransferase 1